MSCQSICAHRCAVFGCLSRTGHGLPENAELRQKWIEVLALEDCKLRSKDSAFVCYNHFASLDYDASSIDSETGDMNLKADVIPSVCLVEGEIAKPKRNRYGAPPEVEAGVHGGRALAKSACRKCNHDTEQCLECSTCERHFHVRCAGRAPVVMLGFDYLNCCKEADWSCIGTDPGRQQCCSVGSDEPADDVPKAEIISIESDESETVTGSSIPAALGTFGECLAGGEAAEETVVVMSPDWFSRAIHSNYTSIASSTDEEFVFPVEEVIIKEEPVDETPDHISSGIIEEDAASTQIGDSPSDAYGRFERKFPILRNTIMLNKGQLFSKSVIQPSTDEYQAGAVALLKKTSGAKKNNLKKNLVVKNDTAKRDLRDFSHEDMDNPHYAGKFYLLAQELLKANLLLSERNKKLDVELKDLKKKIEKGGVDVCARCTRMQRRLCSDPAVKSTNDDGSLKRKAADEDEPIDTVSIIMKREPAPENVTRIRNNATGAKSKKSDSKGPYRIAALEHFVNAVSDMQCDHVLQCPGRCKMKIHSETLSGISGEWTFRCAKCRLVKTVPTEPNYRGTLSESLNPWLKWLGSLPQRHLGYVQTVFEQLNVPFLYKFTPTTLKVAVRKRTVFNPE